MGYQDSDVFLFYGLIITFIVIYIMRKKRLTTRDAHPEDKTAYYRTSAGPAESQTFAITPEDIKGIFVVVTSDEPQTQLMAMSLSTQALLKGKYVRILLCGPGGNLALKYGEEFILEPINKSPQMLMKNLMQKGVIVEICPFYLPNMGGSPADIVEGIGVAKPPEIADGLLEPGVKLFTF
ncbi:hypothetical protein QUF80_20355 [Desulfococcaceae bacterium HSG8]|nr:hypothetical protein [Desulfococcaceae bacterium HSG8]